MDLYIYYRVAEAAAGNLLPQVRAMQAGLAQAHGVATALKRRPEASNGLQTWMEIYQNVPQGFADHLARALEQTSIAALTEGGRHTEIFVDFAECA
jgi:hypothetical protein